MTISIHLPEHIEQQLRQQLGDLDAAAKEAALVELYRQGHLSHGKLAECMGISRPDVDALLASHRVTEDLLTADELSKQIEGLRSALGQ